MAGGTIVGIDIGSQLMKVVEMRKSGAGIEVTALDLAPTPQEAIDNGLIIDSQLLGKALKDLLAKAHVSAKKCVSSISGQSAVVVRVIEVPQVNESELAQQMQFEAERQVPFSITESVMDFCTIPRMTPLADGQPMEVLLAVAQTDFVDKHLEVLKAAGLKPDSIDVEPLAIGRALLDIPQTPQEPGHTIAIINIGASNTDISIFRDKLLAFPRTVPLAGDQLTRAISDYLSVDLVTAEQYKREYGEVLLDHVGQSGTFTGQSDVVNTGGFMTFGAEASSPNMSMPFDFSTTSTIPTFATEEQSPFAVPGAAPVASPFDFAANTGTTTSETAMGSGQFGTMEQPVAPSGTFEQGNTGFASGTSEGGFMQTVEVVNPTSFIPPTGDMTGTGEVMNTGESAALNMKAQVFNCIAPVLAEMVQEIRRSLDYFQGRNENSPIHEIWITGGTASLKGLAPFLQQELGIPTLVADPLSGVRVTSRNYSPEHLQELASLFPVCLGLGARDLVAVPGGKRKR
ncbi:MAG: type IV pilus assembly protein PilM [Armatimonadetes bacterium]|nr:type IV pilus assembly protein PilM [Armatimonadota bacterium]